MKAFKIAALAALASMIGIGAASAASWSSDEHMSSQTHTDHLNSAGQDRLHPYDGEAAPISGD